MNKIFDKNLRLYTSTLLIALSLVQCQSWIHRQARTKASQYTTGELQRFESSFHSKLIAQAGRGRVNGIIRYAVFRIPHISNRQLIKKRRLGRCYLQHGFGVHQKLAESRWVNVRHFGQTYFGKYTIQKLLDTVCDEIIISIQETVLTTILEMTQRTELFMKHVVCNPVDMYPGPPHTTLQKTQKQLGDCAYIGHSKGGAVAFNIARRCMQKTSLMGKQGCSQIRELYSAAGVVQGAMKAILSYGAYLEKQKSSQLLFTKIIGFGLDMFTDMYIDYEAGKTNPIWMDLSPAAPMEPVAKGKKPVPLFVKNNMVLKKTGWLKADFAASGVKYRFKGHKNESLFGCGPRQIWNPNNILCRIFGKTLGQLHSKQFRQTFERGLADMRTNPIFQDPISKNNNYLNIMSWENMQNGDGLADYSLALTACQKGLKLKNRLRAVQKCTVFNNMNHIANAGGAPLALQDIIEQLSK